MEKAEGIFKSLKKLFGSKKPPLGPGPETLSPIPGWDYEVCSEYILALSRGREFLLPIEEYPSRMDLSQSWHETFNQMRSDSGEMWALIGYEAGQRRLVLPRVAEKGLSHSVPYEVMTAGLEKARGKAGISDLVGDIHSHPRPFTSSCWHIPSELTSEGSGAFSVRDIYGLLYKISHQRPADNNKSIMIVVEGNENIAAFATRRSLELTRNYFNDTYDTFAKNWYEKYGWEFKGARPASRGGGEMANRVKDDAAEIWQINRGIAYQYQLALYRGFRDKALLRDYPARNGG